MAEERLRRKRSQRNQEDNNTDDGADKAKHKMLLIIAGLVVCVTLTAYAGVYIFFETSGIASGTSVAGVDASGMSKDTLRSVLQKKADQTITVGFASQEKKITFADAGMAFNIDKAVTEAWNYGHSYNVLLAAYERYFSAHRNDQKTVDVKYQQDKWRTFVAKIRKTTDVVPQNAKIVMGGAGIPVVIAEKSGAAVDEKQIKSDLEDAFNGGNNTIVLDVHEIIPVLTKEKVESWTLNKKLAGFSTSYSSSSGPRKNNIAAAAKRISGQLLMPGQVFSFNKTVGRRTVEGGFQEAPVYVNGKVDKGVGGGICQVSTTLYNAVLLSGLKIVERHNHSMLVHYVPPGRDATVDYGTRDLKFSNPYKTPIYVYLSANGSRLSAAVFGAGDGHSYDIVSTTTSTKPFDVITKHVKSKADMQPKQSGMNGATAVAYRYVYENGQLIRKENLGVSAYKSLSRINYILDVPKPAGDAAGLKTN